MERDLFPYVNREHELLTRHPGSDTGVAGSLLTWPESTPFHPPQCGQPPQSVTSPTFPVLVCGSFDVFACARRRLVISLAVNPAP